MLNIGKVKIVEVGLRDGLQNEQVMLKTSKKLNLVEKLSQTGIKNIELTAFVNSKWIPALYDHENLLRLYNKIPNISYRVLVPNITGYERLRKYNFDEFSIVISASKTHNQKNINSSIAQSIKNYEKIAALAKIDKKPFRAYISCAFGCPYEGNVLSSLVCDVSKSMLDIGAYEVSISDTVGLATPRSTQNLLSQLLKHIPSKKIALHMHNTKNMALSNIYTAMQLGVNTFDSSFGGIGGCPYAQGASGNVATEDLVSMMYSLNIKTSINLDKLCRTSLYAQKILNKKFMSRIMSLYNV